jgi:hypothetical protein
MGNSIEIAKRHYVREVSKEWMEKFWALKPIRDEFIAGQVN